MQGSIHLRTELSLVLDSILFYTPSDMGTTRRTERLRDLGLTPTMQRLAVLEFLEETTSHPTADEVYSGIRAKHPTIARATVYNTLDALTKSGAILRLTVDPAAARYDADLEPHVHFRCRLCNRILDIHVDREDVVSEIAPGHQIESVRTYAFGICASCLADRANDENRKGG